MRVPRSLREHFQEYPVRIADVGARGGWQRKWSTHADFIRFLGFEPDRAEFERLQASAGPNETYFNCALFSEESEITLFHTRSPSVSSIYRPNRRLLSQLIPNDRQWDVIGKEVVSARPLDDVLSEMDLKGVDFLKIDTQGSELDILKGAEDTLLRSAFGVEVEVEFLPLYEGQPLFPDLHAFLADRGYQFIDFPNTFSVRDFQFIVRGSKGYQSRTAFLRAWTRRLSSSSGSWRGARQLLYADAVFLRDPVPYLTVSAANADHRIFSGIFICCALRYYDYAWRLLSTGVEKSLIRSEQAEELHRFVARSAQSPRPVLGDLRRALGRLIHRLQHPGG